MIYDYVLTDGTRINRGERFTPARAEKSFYKKKVEHMQLADWRLDGLSLQQIAEKKGLTRERIRQILVKYFPDIDFPRAKSARGPKYPPFEFNCLKCGKKNILSGNMNNHKRKYCNQECSAHVGLNKMSVEEIRAYNAKRAMEGYYRRKAEDPVAFKEKIRKYNRSSYDKNHVRVRGERKDPVPGMSKAERNKRYLESVRKKKWQDIYERSLPD